MPGGGLEQAVAGWLVLGPGMVLTSALEAGVFGGTSGGTADDVAVDAFAAHFFLNSSTCHQASISLSSSFGSARDGWRRKAASCAAENSFRSFSHGVPFTMSLHVTTVSPRARLFIPHHHILH